MKTLPKENRKIQRKTLTSKSESVDESKRTEVSIITTNSIDIQGDVVLPDGIDRTYFNRNPIVCLSHDMNTQIGCCDWIKPIANGLKAQTRYPVKPSWFKEDWLSDQVFALISSGLMLGKSIGFIATNTRKAKADELKVHPDWKDAQVIDSCILLEYSVCVSGINQDALVVAVNKGLNINAALLGLNMPKRKKSLAQQLEEIDFQKMIDDTLSKYGLII